jgi:rubrerythrin
MTLLEPSLFVRRLVVLSGEHRGYDERFHLGLNLIAGESNAVGKSTVVNLLVFALGADFIDWTPEVQLFDNTLVEIELNQAILTLRRQISGERRRPMDVFWGTLDDAIRAGSHEWERYPYQAGERHESFSMLLFKLLGLPEIQTELSGKLTIHQLFRLIFVDQLTPFNQIFGNEQFDSGAIRREIGSILCGYYSDLEYQLREELRSASDELMELRGRQKILDEFVLSSDQNISVLSITTQLDEAQRKMELAEQSVQQALRNPQSKREISREYRRQLREAQRDVEEAAREAAQTRNDIISLRFAIEDSREFLESLEMTLAALDQSETVREAIGELPIRTCPSCYHPVASTTDENICPLCKEKRDPGTDKTQLFRMRQELYLQRDESIRLQDDRKNQLRILTDQLPNADARLDTSRRALSRLQESMDPALDVTIGSAYRDAGYLQGVVENLQRQLRIVQELELSRNRYAKLVADINRMRMELSDAESRTAERRHLARQLIGAQAVQLLHLDERDQHGNPVEEAFAQCHDVSFSFSKGKIWVDGRESFSASSMVILKNSFHLAVHLASLKDSAFRYPRLLIMDNIEDKGMRPARSHNFQYILRQVSDAAEHPHQIIATTSMIAEDLRDSKYVVGRFYTADAKALRLPDK